MRKRERYSRSDVPRGGARRNVAAVAVLAVLVVCGIGLVAFLWQRANADSNLGDAELSQSLAGAHPSASEPARGTKASGDTFRNVLIFQVDDVHADRPRLTAVSAMCLDVSANKGTLVSLPTKLGVTAADGNASLAELFDASGAADCLAPVAQATGLTFEHVIVLDAAGMSQLESLSSAGANELVSHAGELLDAMRTDMSATDLLDLAESTRAIGMSNLSRLDAPVAAEKNDGGARTTIDVTKLGLEVGTLVEG